MRVMIAEGSPQLSRWMVAAFEEAAHHVIGPARSVSDALRLLSDQICDVGVLDADLAGHCSGPVAEQLRDRSIPFVVVTASPSVLALAHLHGRLVLKPFLMARLLEAVRSLNPAIGGALRP